MPPIFMKEYTPGELNDENPQLAREIAKCWSYVIPRIYDHVAKTLEGQPSDTVAVHSTFFRIEDSEGKTYHIETVMSCQKENSQKDFERILFQIIRVRFHDSKEVYLEAREAVVSYSVKKFGDSLPGTTDYDGIKINLN
jgi:hypothetical protein